MTLTVRSSSLTGATTAARALTHAEMDANWAHVIESSNQNFTPSGSGAVARSASSKLSEVQLAVTDFGVSVSNSASANSTALADAITRAGELSTNGGAALHFPANATIYDFEPLNLSTNTTRIRLVGDGSRSSRIRFSGGSTGAGTYALQWSAADNSFGGLRNIGVLATSAYESVLFVNAPHNEFKLQGEVYLDGGTVCDYIVKTSGGSQFFIDYIYSTGATKKNFYILNGTIVTYIQVNGGNHDIGDEGLALIESTASGGTLALMGGRFEGCTSKNLFQYDCVGASHLRIYGGLFTSGAATSIIKKLTGGADIYYQVGAAFENDPTNIYVDDDDADSTVPVFNNAQRGFIESSKVFNRDVRFVGGTTGATARMRFRNVSNTEYSIYGGSDDNWYFRDETSGAILWAGGTTLGLQMQSHRLQGAQGADVTAAAAITLGAGGNRFRITGGTTIARISAVDWQGGAEITLHFTEAVTITHGTAASGNNKGIKLAGAVDFSAGADDQLQLQYDSTDGFWMEVGRTVI
jgi:hypothetical protein